MSTRLDVQEPAPQLPDMEQEALLDPQLIVEIPQQDIDSPLLSLMRSLPQEPQQAAARKPQWKVVRMRVTAYCTCPRCCGKFSDGYTANMHKVRRNDAFVAADKRVPFGTEMIIPGYNQDRPVQVKDRGRLIKGNRLDVFYNSHKVAKKWGARYLDVMVKVEK